MLCSVVVCRVSASLCRVSFFAVCFFLVFAVYRHGLAHGKEPPHPHGKAVFSGSGGGISTLIYFVWSELSLLHPLNYALYICPHSPVPWISECTNGEVLSNTIPFQNNNPIRVVIHEQSNKGRNHTAGKLVYLPGSLEELMKAGEEKFGHASTRVSSPWKAPRWMMSTC